MSAPRRDAEAASDATTDAALWRRFAGVAGDDVKAAPIYRLRLAGGAADAFGLHLRTPLPGDAMRGEALMSDVWRIGGQKITAAPGAAPWSAPAPSRHFADRVHRFDWLIDLKTQGPEGAARAAALVDRWIEEFGKFHGFAWRAGPTADRVWNWLLAGADVLEAGGEEARSARLDALARQGRHLESAGAGSCDPAARWRSACVQVALAICLRDGRGLPEAEAKLQAACDSQILPDGGHASRSPHRLLHAFIDLQTLADLYGRTRHAPPDALRKWPPRMASMLAFFRVGAGGLSVFQDGAEGRREDLDAAMATLTEPPRSFTFAMRSGYHKLEKAGLRLVVDVGSAPEPDFALRAHCGPLGFDLSDRGRRLISSCGDSPDVNVDWHAAVRRTTAHSTMIVAGRDAASFLKSDDARVLYPTGPDGVSAKRLEESDHVWLEAQHAGWKDKFGLLHRRRLFMASDGARLTGEDALARPVSQGLKDTTKPVAFDLRFHIHPDISAVTVDDAIKLIAPDGRSWRFKTSHEGARLEPSIYLGRGRIERTEQIVLSGQADPNGDGAAPPNCVRWAILREAA